MSASGRSIKVSEKLFKAIENRAKQSRRSVEEELASVIATAPPTDEEAFSEFVRSLELLDDDSLILAAKNVLTPAEQRRVERLHEKRDEEGLTPAEESKLAGLMRKYARTMVVRATALRLLVERGRDVSELLKPPTR